MSLQKEASVPKARVLRNRDEVVLLGFVWIVLRKAVCTLSGDHFSNFSKVIVLISFAMIFLSLSSRYIVGTELKSCCPDISDSLSVSCSQIYCGLP